MRNLLRCRRGVSAFITVIALAPLIGVVALGAEGGSWYVTKQHAQNAADAAAYSGALRVACSISGSSACDTAHDYVYRGKEFAAQNAFCNASGDPTYPGSQCATNLPTRVSQVVSIDRGSWSGAAWTSSATGTDVLATVKQIQPAYLAAVLGFTTIPITSQAIARVQVFPHPPCVLALTGSISLQGSPTLSSPSCGIASNSTASNAFGFKGNNGINVNAPSYTVGGCSQTGGTQCSNVTTYDAVPVPDPLSGLNSAMSSLTTSNFSGGPQVPPALSSVKSLMTDLLIYDPEPYSKQGVNVTGDSSSYFKGIVYVPNTPVTYGGNSSVGTPGCIEVIAYAVTFSGNTKFDDSTCASDGAVVPQVLSVRLVH
jgi:hypothetical protein